jgi:hypothetical protein
MTERESQPTEAMSRGKLLNDHRLSTWELTLCLGEVNTAILKIQGCVYATGSGATSACAYRDLIEKIAPALSRSVTIARLMGGTL